MMILPKPKPDSESNMSWIHDVDDTWPPESSTDRATPTIPAPAPVGCEEPKEADAAIPA